MTADEYRDLTATLAMAVEAAMWNTDFTLQVDALAAVQDALEYKAKGLPLPDAARLRLEVLQILKRADGYADDPRAKEFGTTYCLLATMTRNEQLHLAQLLVSLLRFAAARSEPKS